MKLGKLFVLFYSRQYMKLGSFFNFVRFVLQNKSSALINVHLDFEGRIDELFFTMANIFWNTNI